MSNVRAERFEVKVNRDSDFANFELAPATPGQSWMIVEGYVLPDAGMASVTFKDSSGTNSIEIPITGNPVQLPAMFIHGGRTVASDMVPESTVIGEALQMTTSGIAAKTYIAVKIAAVPRTVDSAL